MRRWLLVLSIAVCAEWLASARSFTGPSPVLAEAAQPTMGLAMPGQPVRVRPTRRPRVRPLRPPRVHSSPTPTATGTPPGTIPTATPEPPPVTDCAHACAHTISQMRMLWYGALSFTAVIKNGACPPLSPDPGETGTVQMTHFITGQRQDTGHNHVASFVLGNNGAGVTSLGGTVQFSRVVDSYTFSYSAPVPAFANIRAGQNFPVAFNMCLTLGNQAVRMHLVCQGKSQGMLCHEG